MRQKKEARHHQIPWISVTLVLLAIATVGYFTQPGLSGALVYRDYGYGSGYGGGGSFFGSGQLNIIEFYEEYQLYIDALIFLLIFLSVGKAVFLKHFNTGGKALYIALGLALTLGLLIWEQREGFSIIANLGPIGIFVLVVVCLIGLYIGVYRVTKSIFLSLLLTLGLALFFASIFPDVWAFLKEEVFFYIADKVSYTLGIDTSLASILFLIVTFGLGFAAVKWINSKMESR